MPSKNRKPTAAQVAKLIKQGFGQGELDDYKPWFYVRDVPSEGESCYVTSRVTSREHHYLSDLEYRGHLRAEYAPKTKDIREQYALLPIERTRELAERLGFRHPEYPGTPDGTPFVMSTDILVTEMDPNSLSVTECAYSVKLEKDLTQRALEKLLIEKVFWNSQGVRWHLLTEEHLKTSFVDNLLFFAAALRIHDWKHCGVAVKPFNDAFEAHCRRGLSYSEALQCACEQFSLDSAIGHRLVGAAVFDYSSKLVLDRRTIAHRSVPTLAA